MRHLQAALNNLDEGKLTHAAALVSHAIELLRADEAAKDMAG